MLTFPFQILENRSRMDCTVHSFWNEDHVWIVRSILVLFIALIWTIQSIIDSVTDPLWTVRSIIWNVRSIHSGKEFPYTDRILLKESPNMERFSYHSQKNIYMSSPGKPFTVIFLIASFLSFLVRDESNNFPFK